MSKSTNVLVIIVAFSYISLYCFVKLSQAQSTTDPIEVAALNTIFQRWGITAQEGQWNISGEPCSGRAIDSTPSDNTNYNPLIKCDCSENNGLTCHITELKVFELDIVGVFPQEIRNFTRLANLNLFQNYLTGPLPAFIGELTSLQYISLGHNMLSGELPKELGNLTDLRSLGLSITNFSGSLPSELGNLPKLENLYFDSNRITGEIPSTFANLLSLKILRGSDNHLTGKLPDFIGNWTKLTDLRLQGNSFEGPIPLALSNLTALINLRLSDLSNGSSSLEFIKDMKSLSILILRNNNISGTIPSNIGEFQSLSLLDLSFNNLFGQIPNSLFNLGSLSYVFLGNNQLSGTLPSQKSATLTTIDVSYNELSGNFPSWVSEQSLQLNLVANSFNIEGSNGSSLPPGLSCLQRNFPCNRGSPRYYSFAIKCGGPEVRSSYNVLFERDDWILGPASYNVTDKKRWAVSNVGMFAENENPQYTYSRPYVSQFTNTLDPQLLQTGRVSSGSLRYYGLGLENGIYTVNLLFVETFFDDSQSWRSHGRRVFDIYLQGNLFLKDFDIQREAGGFINRAVQKEFKAEVSENYLEIHLFWAGKGTCCVPVRGTYGPSISAIYVTPDFKPTTSNSSPTKKKKRTGLIVGISVSFGLIIFLSAFVTYAIQRRKRKGIKEDEDFLVMASRPNTFTYAELKSATDDFNPANKLGEGGFGPVYKGKLSDGRVVAVKQLAVTSLQGKSQFITEIATISAVQHRNLVRLFGCCIEGDRQLLVYEYLQYKSLDQALFGKSGLHLNWPTRYEICLGTARGLAYLHEDSRPRIVHRDVKPSNILLDDDLNPKISDFGLAKLYDDKNSHISTGIAGTIGYLAPEYAMRGHLTEKADVFGFGVVALEILSGRTNYDSSLNEEKMYLLEWAWILHETNNVLELVDPTLSEFNEEEAKRVIGVSLLCTQASPMLRPSMSRVMAMITGDIEVSPVTTKPGYLTDWNIKDRSSFMGQSISLNSMTGNAFSQHNDSPGMVIDAENSPINDEQSVLHEITREGR